MIIVFPSFRLSCLLLSLYLFPFGLIRTALRGYLRRSLQLYLWRVLPSKMWSYLFSFRSLLYCCLLFVFLFCDYIITYRPLQTNYKKQGFFKKPKIFFASAFCTTKSTRICTLDTNTGAWVVFCQRISADRSLHHFTFETALTQLSVTTVFPPYTVTDEAFLAFR